MELVNRLEKLLEGAATANVFEELKKDLLIYFAQFDLENKEYDYEDLVAYLYDSDNEEHRFELHDWLENYIYNIRGRENFLLDCFNTGTPLFKLDGTLLNLYGLEVFDEMENLERLVYYNSYFVLDNWLANNLKELVNYYIRQQYDLDSEAETWD